MLELIASVTWWDSGHMTVRSTALSEDSTVARMVRLVEEAQSQRSHTELLVEQIAKYYTPGIYISNQTFFQIVDVTQTTLSPIIIQINAYDVQYRKFNTQKEEKNLDIVNYVQMGYVQHFCGHLPFSKQMSDHIGEFFKDCMNFRRCLPITCGR